MLKPSSNTFKVGEFLSVCNYFDNYDYNEVPMGDHIFNRTIYDDKTGKSVEDKLFLDVMHKEFLRTKKELKCTPAF